MRQLQLHSEVTFFICSVLKLSGECCWAEVKHEGRNPVAGKDAQVHATDSPFDMVAVTKLTFVMKGIADDNFEFVWRIQSVGETESDLQYQIAPDYVDCTSWSNRR